ncbi:MAG: hypothetical protein AAGA75_09150 [Cyanobacteria bacterium P01_E01_bin.6]
MLPSIPPTVFERTLEEELADLQIAIAMRLMSREELEAATKSLLAQNRVLRKAVANSMKGG